MVNTTQKVTPDLSQIKDSEFMHELQVRIESDISWLKDILNHYRKEVVEYVYDWSELCKKV